jgi:hypothetical protein
MGDGGKGSSPRPVDKKKFDEGWDRIFGNKKKPVDTNAENVYNDERLVSNYDKKHLKGKK